MNSKAEYYSRSACSIGKSRKYLFWLFVSALFIAILCWHFANRHNTSDWSRDEAHYRGHPTKYWREELHNWRVCYFGSLANPRAADSVGFKIVPHPQVLSKNTAATSTEIAKSKNSDSPPALIIDRNPEALPVLVALLKDEDPNTRSLALYAIARLGKSGITTVPILRRLIRDESRMVRLTALIAVASIGRDASTAEFEIMEAMKDKDPDIQAAAEFAYWHVCCETLEK